MVPFLDAFPERSAQYDGLMDDVLFEQARFDSAGRRSPVRGAPALRDLVGRARELLPAVRAQAAQFERDGRVSADMTEQFRQAGLLRLMQPARFGGYEYGFTAFMDVVTEIGR